MEPFAHLGPGLWADPYGAPAPECRPGQAAPVLYHYTDEAGLLGIVQDGAIRATVVRFLNDTSEVMHAITMAADIASRHDAMSTALRPGLEKFIEYVAHVGNPEPNVCAVSFSEDANVLSQWRAYGGYAIGFEWRWLAAAGPRWRLVRCRYDRTEQAELLHAALDRALRTLAPEPEPEDVSRSVYSEVLMVATAIKHPDFHEEREWRLVSSPIESTELKVRQGRYGLVMYAEVRLPQADPRTMPIREVMVGPGPHQEHAKMGAVGLFTTTPQRGLWMPGIQCSGTPFLP